MRDHYPYSTTMLVLLAAVPLATGFAPLSRRRHGKSMNLVSTTITTDLLFRNETESNPLESFPVPTAAAATAAGEPEEKEDDLNWFRFGGIGRLFSQSVQQEEETSCQQQQEDLILERLQSATVAVIGLGGIGSWTAESLGRSGIGHLMLVDLDDLCISSTNRQLHALSNNVGELKTSVLSDRLHAMNPSVQVTAINDFVMSDTVHDIVNTFQQHHVQAVIDTLDDPDDKAALWKACAQHNIPVMACGSAAGRWDPTQIQCQDMYTINPTDCGDAVLQATIENVLCTDEDEDKPWMSVQCVYIPNELEKTQRQQTEAFSSFRTSDAMGTASFVSGSIGLAAAAKVVEGIARQTL